MRIVTLFFALLPVLAHAQTFGGIGTRASGMGGAFVAVADDATAAYWNPAGLATGATFDFQVSRNPDWFVGAATPVLGLSFYRAHTVRSIPDRKNGGSGELPVRTLATSNVGVTVVQSVVSALVVGTTVRVVNGGVDQFDSRTTMDLDAGAMVSMGSVRVGISGRNLFEPEFASDVGPIAAGRQVRVGVALVPRSASSGVHGPFSLAADADLMLVPGPFGDERFAAVGGEFWIAKGLLGLRGGTRWSTLEEPEPELAGGLTVRLPWSLFVEGQVTKPVDGGVAMWNFGARITF